MQNGDEASPSIIVAGRALLVKMIITLEPHVRICTLTLQNFVRICTLTLQKGDGASPTIILTGRALLVKMIIIF